MHAIAVNILALTLCLDKHLETYVALLLTWFNFDLSIDKLIHIQ